MKKTTIITSATVVLVAGVIAVTLASNKKTVDSRKSTTTEQATVAVSTMTVEMKETDRQLRLVGTAQASKEVSIAAEASGKVVKLNFKMGDFVAQGQLLAQLDDTYKRLSYENAKLSYNKCKDDYERNQALRKGDAISETQLRDVKMAYDNAANQLATAKKQWDDTRIVAPFSGYITAKNTELGAYLNAGNPVAYIADITNLKVTLDVSESNVYQLSNGQSVAVTTDVEPDLHISGKISNIGQKATSAHTYPVEIMIANNGKAKLKAGTYVNVEIGLGKSGKALMISRDAIVSSVKDPSVYVVRQGKAELTKITVGRSYESTLEVLGGLSNGDRVVTSGQINLSDGSKVTMIN